MFGLLAAVGPAYARAARALLPRVLQHPRLRHAGRGVFAAVYTIYCTSDSLRNAGGDDISSVSLAGRTVNVDTDLSLY